MKLALVATAALALAGSARAAGPAHFVSLPSPLAPLSLVPPLGGGATSTSEGYRHRVDAITRVVVSVDPVGVPFAVRAVQRLDVRVKGDYFFTIGAPVTAVEAAPGSASTPGFRSTSILWAGFNPGHRVLSARATLDPAAAVRALPLRIDASAREVTLVNTTAVGAGAFSADALTPSLRTYLAQLQRDVARGRQPVSGGAYVTSKPVPVSLRVLAPLHVQGTVGDRRIDTVVLGRTTVRATGRVALTATPVDPADLLADPPARASGRALLARATTLSLTLARVRQYRTFLGNPDPTGRNETTYVYRTTARPAPQPVAQAERPGSNWATRAALVAGLLAALGGAAFAWSRS